MHPQHMITNLFASVTISALSGIAFLFGQVIGKDSHISIGMAASVLIFIATMVFYLSQKLQRIEDTLKWHGEILRNLPCKKKENGSKDCDVCE